MTISINTKEFVRVAGVANAAMDARTANLKPALGCLLLEGNGRSGKLTGCDLETFICVEFECDATKPASCLLPGQMLSGWLALVRDDVVHVTPSDMGARLDCGRSRLMAPAPPPAEYPQFRPDPPQEVHEMTCGQMRAALRVRYACDVDTSRYAFGGVCFHARDGILFAVATCGKQCPVFTIGSTPLANGMWLLPAAAAAKIARSLPESESASCDIRFTHNSAFVSSSLLSIESRLLEGRFPEYWKFTSSESHASLVAPVKQLAEAVKMASLVAGQESKYGRKYGQFAASEGELSVSANGVGEALAVIPVSYKGPGVTASLGLPYIADFLSNCTGIDDVELHLCDGEGVAHIDAGQNFRTYIMQLGVGT